MNPLVEYMQDFSRKCRSYEITEAARIHQYARGPVVTVYMYNRTLRMTVNAMGVQRVYSKT